MTSFGNNKFTFRFFLSSVSILFVLYFLNDMDVDSQYFAKLYAEEIAIDNNNDSNHRNKEVDFTYTVDSSEYFEEDNVPQRGNYNTSNNYINRNNSQLIQQQYEEQKDYNQVKKDEKVLPGNRNDNQKYEFTSIESKQNNNTDSNYEKSDYAIFKVVINLQNIKKEGYLRLISYINGQSFKEDIQLSQLDQSKISNKLDVKLKVLKDTELISLSPPDEFHACAYHIKDLKKEYNSILNFDCNEADVQSSDGLNTIRLFKPSSLKYNDTQTFFEQNQNEQIHPNAEGERTIKDKTNGLDNKDNDDKVFIKVISPLGDRKNTKQLKIAAMVRGQIQTELIKDVQKELGKSKDDTITRTFTFDRNTDIGNIQIGDLFLACVTSEDLNPPEGQECEKRLVKKFNSENSLSAR